MIEEKSEFGQLLNSSVLQLKPGEARDGTPERLQKYCLELGRGGGNTIQRLVDNYFNCIDADGG